MKEAKNKKIVQAKKKPNGRKRPRKVQVSKTSFWKASRAVLTPFMLSLFHTGLDGVKEQPKTSLDGQVKNNSPSGVLGDPYEQDSLDGMKKKDTMQITLTHGKCLNDEDFSSTTDVAGAQGDITWCPPALIKRKTTDPPLSDKRGVLQDFLESKFSVKNILEQPITVEVNVPRADITDPTSVYTRLHMKRWTINPGETRHLVAKFRDNTGTDCLHVAVLPIPNEGVVTLKRNRNITLFTYNVRVPKINRSSNSVFDKDTEAVKITVEQDYIVSDTPIGVTSEARVEYTVLGLPKYVDSRTVKARSWLDSTRKNGTPKGLDAPIWVDIKQNIPSINSVFVKAIKLTQFDDKEAWVLFRGTKDWDDSAERFHLSTYEQERYVLQIPGLSMTLPVDSSDDVGYAVFSLFRYSTSDGCWYLWDPRDNTAVWSGESNVETDHKTHAAMNIMIPALVFDLQRAQKTNMKAIRPLACIEEDDQDFRGKITADDIIGVCNAVITLVEIIGLFF